ncbi:MAG: hypothetical protein CSA21_00640 [Deltaproteobacteria bacterium]|nr:MAG: hypothetical protein CSA21_00640 [Deltaproteobacteria bacterium]
MRHSLHRLNAVFLFNDQWRVVEANEDATILAQISSEELIGLPVNQIPCFVGQASLLDDLLTPSDSRQYSAPRQIIFACRADTTTPRSAMAIAIPMPGDNPLISGALIIQDIADSQAIHHLLLNSIHEGVVTVNRDMIITSFNKAAEEITGWSKEEAVGQKCNQIFPPQICGKNCLVTHSIQKEEVLANRAVVMTNRNGKVFPLSLTTAPLYGFDGKIIGGVQTFHDNSLAVHNRLILDSVADGVCSMDNALRITSFNRSAERITGWSADEAIGKSCREIFDSSVCTDGCHMQAAMHQGIQLHDQPIFIKGKDGYSIPVSTSTAPLTDELGSIVGGIKTFRDNSSSLREALILDSIADGVFTVDRNWKITSFNRAAEEITGWDRKKAIGHSCAEVFFSSICGKNCAIAESLYTGGPILNRSVTIVNTQGKKLPVSISTAPLTDHEGNIIGGVETFRDLSTITNLRKQLRQRYTFDEIISKSAAMQRLFTIMADIARSPSTVLILGESGTGKELVARALYSASERKDKPFIAVNCGALPETLLESELFGYKAGAFTDARKDRKGRFAAAEGGTLFLDEIGDIPPSVQIKLLRVLQEKVYEPLGSSTPVKADVRIITATNRDLQAMVENGSFRDDLFYRLNVVKINLPPLRERKEDIPLLADHFIKSYNAQQGKNIAGISTSALSILMRHHFPGNIRELENIIEYSFILCASGYIQPEHLPEPFAPADDQQHNVSGSGASSTHSLEEIERQAIAHALERNKWKKMVTCRELGISKDTLRRKIKKFNLVNPWDHLNNSS